jgi:hypothetical protein
MCTPRLNWVCVNVVTGGPVVVAKGYCWDLKPYNFPSRNFIGVLSFRYTVIRNTVPYLEYNVAPLVVL